MLREGAKDKVSCKASDDESKGKALVISETKDKSPAGDKSKPAKRN